LTERARRFIDLALPDAFVLEVPAAAGGWVDYGLFHAADFDRMDDGAYVCAGHGGSPLFLRCVAQSDDLIECVDGGGDRWVGRLVPYDA
jgi:hypothetical protein